MMRALWLLPLLFAACTTPNRIVILHFNDFHGQIRPHPIVQRPGVVRTMGGFQTVAGYVRAQRAGRHDMAALESTGARIFTSLDWRLQSLIQLVHKIVPGTRPGQFAELLAQRIKPGGRR